MGRKEGDMKEGKKGRQEINNDNENNKQGVLTPYS